MNTHDDNTNSTNQTSAQAAKRAERERQYQIDAVTFEYVTAWKRAEAGEGEKPRIEDFVHRYPQFTGELLEFALYWHTIGFASYDIPLDGPIDGELSPAAQKALARIRAESEKGR